TGGSAVFGPPLNVSGSIPLGIRTILAAPSEETARSADDETTTNACVRASADRSSARYRALRAHLSMRPECACRIVRAPAARAAAHRTIARRRGRAGAGATLRWTTPTSRARANVWRACAGARRALPTVAAPGLPRRCDVVFRKSSRTLARSQGSPSTSATKDGIPPVVGAPCPTIKTRIIVPVGRAGEAGWSVQDYPSGCRSPGHLPRDGYNEVR